MVVLVGAQRRRVAIIIAGGQDVGMSCDHVFHIVIAAPHRLIGRVRGNIMAACRIQNCVKQGTAPRCKAAAAPAHHPDGLLGRRCRQLAQGCVHAGNQGFGAGAFAQRVADNAGDGAYLVEGLCVRHLDHLGAAFGQHRAHGRRGEIVGEHQIGMHRQHFLGGVVIDGKMRRLRPNLQRRAFLRQERNGSDA